MQLTEELKKALSFTFKRIENKPHSEKSSELAQDDDDRIAVGFLSDSVLSNVRSASETTRATRKLKMKEEVSRKCRNLIPRAPLFLPRESSLVAAGHVSMYTNQSRTKGRPFI